MSNTFELSIMSHHQQRRMSEITAGEAKINIFTVFQQETARWRVYEGRPIARLEEGDRTSPTTK